MGANWMWLLVAVAAASHALRWVPGRTSLRQVKIPAVFVVLYVIYAAALGQGGPVALVLSFLIVEVALHLWRRYRPQDAGASGGRRR